MTARRRSIKEAEAVKLQLVELMKDTFDNNGQVVKHDELAKEHVLKNKSISAADDVQDYGGPAVVELRRKHDYAIVPVTRLIDVWTGKPASEKEIADTVAGLGAGGNRVGWYMPANEDDWLWVYYIGHLAKAGSHAIFWAANQVQHNGHLTGPAMLKQVASAATASLPVPAGEVERKLLKEQSGRK